MDKYTDYLIAGFSLATVTRASSILDTSKDKLSRFLGGVSLVTKGGNKGNIESHTSFSNQDLWKLVKTEVRNSERLEKAILIVDDTIVEKPYTDENDIIAYNFDHKTGKSIKGMNLLNGGLYYQSQDKYIPIFQEIITKDIKFTDKDGKVKRKSSISKNQLFQDNFNSVMRNHIQLEAVVFDIWFGSVDNFNFIHNHKQKYICPLKSNRRLALSLGEKKKGRWYNLEEVSNQLETQKTLQIWLEGATHYSYLTKQVFSQEDAEITMFLITNDANFIRTQIHEIYQKRWKIEEFHKSLKSNLSLATSPTKNKTSQANHVFCSIVAFFKLEVLTKATTFKNHFQFKSSLYLKALQASFKALQFLKGCER